MNPALATELLRMQLAISVFVLWSKKESKKCDWISDQRRTNFPFYWYSEKSSHGIYTSLICGTLSKRISISNLALARYPDLKRSLAELLLLQSAIRKLHILRQPYTKLQKLPLSLNNDQRWIEHEKIQGLISKWIVCHTCRTDFC